MMKFVLFLALLAFYSATPTLGLKCYVCIPYDAIGLDQQMTCRELDKLIDADKKSKATLDCPTGDDFFCGTGTDVNDEKRIIKTCFSKIKMGCENVEKGPDNLDYKVCGCKTDYCNSENSVTKSDGDDKGKRKNQSPGFEASKILILGAFAVLIFLINVNTCLY